MNLIDSDIFGTHPENKKYALTKLNNSPIDDVPLSSSSSHNSYDTLSVSDVTENEESIISKIIGKKFVNFATRTSCTIV